MIKTALMYLGALALGLGVVVAGFYGVFYLLFCSSGRSLFC